MNDTLIAFSMIGLFASGGIANAQASDGEAPPYFEADLAGCKADSVRIKEALDRVLEGKAESDERLHLFHDSFPDHEKDRAIRTCLAYYQGQQEVRDFYVDKLVLAVCEDGEIGCHQYGEIWVRNIRPSERP